MIKSKEFIKAFKAYSDLIYNYVYLRVGRRKEISEELTQEIFVKVWINRKGFDRSKASLKTWLFRIARNITIDYYRTNRVKTFSISSEEEDCFNLEESAVEEDLKCFIIKKLDLLNIRDRELLTLRFIEDLSIREIAKIINKGYSATKVAIHRALNKLRKIINKG